MASAAPIAGSAYTYAYATLGELIGWIIGWDLILEYALGATTVAIGWSGYVVSFLKDFSVVIPAAYASSPFAYDAAHGVWQSTGAVINVPAMAVIVAITTLLVVGVWTRIVDAAQAALVNSAALPSFDSTKTRGLPVTSGIVLRLKWKLNPAYSAECMASLSATSGRRSLVAPQPR